MDAECREIVAYSWNSNDNRVGIKEVLERLTVCAKKTDEWELQKFRKIKIDITRLQRDIKARKSYSSFGVYLREIVEMEKELDTLQTHNEIY